MSKFLSLKTTTVVLFSTLPLLQLTARRSCCWRREKSWERWRGSSSGWRSIFGFFLFLYFLGCFGILQISGVFVEERKVDLWLIFCGLFWEFFLGWFVVVLPVGDTVNEREERKSLRRRREEGRRRRRKREEVRENEGEEKGRRGKRMKENIWSPLNIWSPRIHYVNF